MTLRPAAISAMAGHTRSAPAMAAAPISASERPGGQSNHW
jgi:hypothetical protein